MLKGKIDFREGLVYFKNIQFFLFSINSILCLINKIFEYENLKTIYDILENISKDDSFLISENSKNIKSIKGKILYFLNIINSIGIGEVNIKILSKEKIIFKIDNCILSKAYFKIFKKKPIIKIEYLNAFFIKNFLECLFNKEIEQKIKINNKNELIFLYKINPNKSKFCFNKANYYLKKDKNINDLLKKIIINKQIIIKDGYFNLLGSYAVIFPIYFVFNLYNNLDPKKYSSYLINLGYVHGICAVEFLKQKYGFDKKKLLSIICQQSSIVGVGKIKVINFEPFKFQISNNFQRYYKYFLIENINVFYFYFYNVFKGAYDKILNNNSEIIIDKSINFKTTSINFSLNKQQKTIYKNLKLRLIIK